MMPMVMSLSRNMPMKIRMTMANQPFREKKSANGQITAPMNQPPAALSHFGRCAERDMKSTTRCSNTALSPSRGCAGSAMKTTVVMPTTMSAAMAK